MRPASTTGDGNSCSRSRRRRAASAATGLSCAGRSTIALRQVKEGGKRLGNPTNLAEAQRKGAATMKAARVFPSIRDIQKRGAPSLHTIAETLNARGITTAQSKRWSAMQLSKLLKRAAEAESVVHHLPGHVQKGFAHAMTKRLS